MSVKRVTKACVAMQTLCSHYAASLLYYVSINLVVNFHFEHLILILILLFSLHVYLFHFHFFFFPF